MFVIRRWIVVGSSWTLAVVLGVATAFVPPARFAHLLLAGVAITVGVAVCASADIMLWNHRRIMTKDLDRREQGLRQVQ